MALGILLTLAGPLVVAAAVIAVSGAYACVRYPYVGILLYLVFEYVRPGEMAPALETLRPLRVIVILTGLGWLAQRSRSPGWRFVWTSQAWAVLSITAALAISALTAVWPGRAAAFALDGAKTVCVFVLMTSLVATRERVSQTVGLIVALAAWLAIATMLGYARTGQAASGPAKGFLGDANDLAMALLVAFPLAVSLARVASGIWARMAAGVAAVAMLWAVIFTFSRGGFAGMVFTLLATALLSRRRVLALSVVCVLGLALWCAAPQSYHARIATIAQQQQDESLQGRRYAWQAAVRMFHDRPFFGVGGGNFELAYGRFYRPPGASSFWRAAHSIYYQCLGELGAAGCLSFGLLLFFTFRDLWRLRRIASSEWERQMATGIGVGLGAYVVSGTFLSALYYPHPYMLAALTVGLASARSRIKLPTGAEVIGHGMQVS